MIKIDGKWRHTEEEKRQVAKAVSATWRRKNLDGSSVRIVNKMTGRHLARRLYPAKKCERCGSKKRLERHHKDDNPLNNVRSNVQILCIVCHNIVDGRLQKFVGQAKTAWKKFERRPNGTFSRRIDERKIAAKKRARKKAAFRRVSEAIIV